MSLMIPAVAAPHPSLDAPVPAPDAPSATAPVPPLDPPAPIRRAGDATAVLASLGDPPLKGQGDLSKRHMYLVVESAANLAMGLATLAGVAETTPADEQP